MSAQASPKVTFNRRDTERVLHAVSFLIAMEAGLAPAINRSDGKPADPEALRLWAIDVILDFLKDAQRNAGLIGRDE